MLQHRIQRLAAAAGLLALAVCSSAQAQEVPRGEASLQVEFRAGAQIEVGQVLSMWARKFDALVVQDPTLDAVRIRFLTPVQGPMTWDTVKRILAFHQVIVTEEQPSPDGPWVIKARHERTAQQLVPEGPPLGPEQLPQHSALVTAVVQLEHGAGRAILPVIQVLMNRGPVRGQVLYVPGPELLILVDLVEKVRHYLSLVRQLDVPGPGRQVTLHELQHAPVEEAVALLSQVLGSLSARGDGGAQVGPPASSQRSAQVYAYPRTNLLVSVATQAELAQIERVLERIDRPSEDARLTHVYHCRHADPAYLASRLAELLGGTGGTPAPDADPSAVVVAGEGRDVSDVETRIVPDQRNGSLLILCEPARLDDVLALLAEVDRVPRRVMIQVEIWEIATPTDQVTLGVELASLDPPKDGSTRLAALTSFGLSTLATTSDAAGNVNGFQRVPALGAGGISAALHRGGLDQIPVIVTAIQNFEEATLVTRPTTYTNDNVTVTFEVSDSFPFIRQVISDGVTTSTVDYAEASTELEITPHINSSGNLTLEVSLNLSSFSGSGSPDLPPPTNRRSYAATITVPNNRYVVFGGLEVETERKVEAKVPFLGDIPILGHLFKRWTHSRSKSRLYVFVRPTILDDEGFRGEVNLAQRLRERAHVEAKRDDWLPPLVPDRLLRPEGWSLQDEALEVFGTGSADPF